MTIQLNLLALVTSLIIPVSGPPAEAPLALSRPKEPVAKMQQIKQDDLKKLGRAPFHFAPMGTYDSSYVLGQCTWGAASMKGDVPSWGNANRWDDGARSQGIEVSSIPIVGAVAQTDRGYYGHVAIVTEVYPDHTTIEEMNYDGLGVGSVRTRAAPLDEFVYIYLN